MKSSKPAQHALPHNTKYTLVSTFHTGGLENGVPCQNCGKVLTNVAVVKNTENDSFQVGLDCAATLATVNPFEFNAAEEAFSLGKKVRAAIQKYSKKFGGEFALEVYEFLNREQQVEISLNGLRVRASDDSRDRYFTYYMSPELYAAVVKPMGGELLPERPQTAEEQLADQQARHIAYEAKHGTPAEQAAKHAKYMAELGFDVRGLELATLS